MRTKSRCVHKGYRRMQKQSVVKLGIVVFVLELSQLRITTYCRDELQTRHEKGSKRARKRKPERSEDAFDTYCMRARLLFIAFFFLAPCFCLRQASSYFSASLKRRPSQPQETQRGNRVQQSLFCVALFFLNVCCAAGVGRRRRCFLRNPRTPPAPLLEYPAEKKERRKPFILFKFRQ